MNSKLSSSREVLKTLSLFVFFLGNFLSDQIKLRGKLFLLGESEV